MLTFEIQTPCQQILILQGVIMQNDKFGNYRNYNGMTLNYDGI